MNATYFIKGTVSIQVLDKILRICLIPSVGFLAPDKQRVIAFPLTDEADICDAKLIKLKANKKYIEFSCDAKIAKTYLGALIGVAAQQKPVEFRLEIFEQAEPVKDLKITGFVFPAPDDYANRG